MYRSRPDIYKMLSTLSLEMKVELLEYLKADIAAAKAAPKKSYLEEQWEEIMRLIENLKYEPYIDDQLEIDEIWNICDEMIKSGKLRDESWPIRKYVLESIINGEYYDYFGVSDPMRDLFNALLLSKEEKIEIADTIFKIGSGYMKQEGARIYQECGQQDKYISFVEHHLGIEHEPYLEVIQYYRDKNLEKAVEIAKLGFKKCKDDQTDIIIFLMQYAKETGDDDWYTKLLKSAKLRGKVNYSKVLESMQIENPQIS